MHGHSLNIGSTINPCCNPCRLNFTRALLARGLLYFMCRLPDTSSVNLSTTSSGSAILMLQHQSFDARLVEKQLSVWSPVIGAARNELKFEFFA